MSEWWTYQLSDFLMFSSRTYYRQFELLNAELWPAQIIAIALGLAIPALWWRKLHAWREIHAGRIAAIILAAAWLCVAWAYLLDHFDDINWVGKYLAAGFALQALLLVWAAVRNRLVLRGPGDRFGRAGMALLGLALIGYPLIGILFGRPWMQAEVFGIAPDPTVMATLGVVTAAVRPHWELLALPLIWCAYGGATLWTMESPDAALLPAAAILTIVLAVWKSWSARSKQA
jgi:hypothetical protein